MDAYWRYSSGGQQAAVLPALTPLVAKRPRNKYVAPSGPGYYERGMMRDKDSMEASYECYLRNGQISSMHSEIMGIQPGPVSL
uniref:Nucleic acid binding protein n=1 Tax=Solanum tuberosum TaxID=4113 RepID=M0ZL67_SOLTU